MMPTETAYVLQDSWERAARQVGAAGRDCVCLCACTNDSERERETNLDFSHKSSVIVYFHSVPLSSNKQLLGGEKKKL